MAFNINGCKAFFDAIGIVSCVRVMRVIPKTVGTVNEPYVMNQGYPIHPTRKSI